MNQRVEGVVFEVNAEIAKVRIRQHSECNSCGSCQGENAMILDASNIIGSKPGQNV